MQREKGYVLGIVVIALVALSIGGAAILTLSGGEADLAGQVRKQKNLEACAVAGVNADIAALPANLPSTLNPPADYVIDSSLTAKSEHYSSLSGSPASFMYLPPHAAMPLLARSGENVTNRFQSGGSTNRRAIRLVSTCVSATGQRMESTSAIVYGGGR